MYNNPRWGRIVCVVGGYSAFMLYLWYGAHIITEINLSTFIMLGLFWFFAVIAWWLVSLVLIPLSYLVAWLMGFLGFGEIRKQALNEQNGLTFATLVIAVAALIAAPVSIIVQHPYSFPLLRGLLKHIFKV